MTGYLHPLYAASLGDFGEPRLLPRSRGWILTRQIAGFPHRDAMGCYPLFACQDWSQLHRDLDDITGDELVSLVGVADPFGDHDEATLRRCFKDVVRPFKEHFVVDVQRPIGASCSKHHRYYARRALRNVTVETLTDAAGFLDEWLQLYAALVERHKLHGIKAFSRSTFARQLTVPGLVAFRALSGGLTVGAHLWFVQGDVAYSHLAACTPRGYDLMASYAMHWSAIEYFADRVRWLCLGAGAGVKCSALDGLSRFKQGWSTGTRTAYLCGRIFNSERYEEIDTARGISATGQRGPTGAVGRAPTDYFPIYRQGELA